MKPWGNIPVACRGKRVMKGKRGSSTSGRSKGIVASPLQKTLAKRSRSYKYAEYQDWREWSRKRVYGK